MLEEVGSGSGDLGDGGGDLQHHSHAIVFVIMLLTSCFGGLVMDTSCKAVWFVISMRFAT